MARCAGRPGGERPPADSRGGRVGTARIPGRVRGLEYGHDGDPAAGTARLLRHERPAPAAGGGEGEARLRGPQRDPDGWPRYRLRAIELQLVRDRTKPSGGRPTLL